MSRLRTELHTEDPIIAAPSQPLVCPSISQKSRMGRVILLYIYADGSSGYSIITKKNKDKNPIIREVTANTEQMIRDVAHCWHVVYQTRLVESNIARIPTDKEEPANTDDGLDTLLEKINKLLNAK